MSYVTGDYIIAIVYQLLGSLSVAKYLTTAPDSASGKKARPAEYIVINCLPVDANVMQKCYVNVNYHVKDIGPGQKDQVKLEAGSQSVLSILEKVTATSYLIDFERQETFREEQLGEHYSNLRFSFKFINK